MRSAHGDRKRGVRRRSGTRQRERGKPRQLFCSQTLECYYDKFRRQGEKTHMAGAIERDGRRQRSHRHASAHRRCRGAPVRRPRLRGDHDRGRGRARRGRRADRLLRLRDEAEPAGRRARREHRRRRGAGPVLDRPWVDGSVRAGPGHGGGTPRRGDGGDRGARLADLRGRPAGVRRPRRGRPAGGQPPPSARRPAPPGRDPLAAPGTCAPTSPSTLQPTSSTGS